MAPDPLGLAFLTRVWSPVHRLSPTSKMVWLACAVALSFTPDLSHLGVLSLLTLLIAVTMTGASLGQAWKPLRLLIIVWGPFVLVPPIAYHLQAGVMGMPASDTTSLDLGTFDVAYSRTGLQYGVTTFLRGLVAAMATVTVVWTTHPRDIVYALTNAARLPYRLAWAVFLALIYTPLILHEYEVITYAKAVRGLRNRPGPIGMIDAVRNTFFPLLVRGLRKGNVTSLAMESRAFGAGPTRTFRHEPPRSSLDAALSWGSIVVTVGYFGWLLVIQRLVGS